MLSQPASPSAVCGVIAPAPDQQIAQGFHLPAQRCLATVEFDEQVGVARRHAIRTEKTHARLRG